MPDLTQYDIARIRALLLLNQTQFAQLLGVHPMTVSKWERGMLQPDHYRAALLAAFADAAKNPRVCVGAGLTLARSGPLSAVALLLKHLSPDSGDNLVSTP